MVDFNSEGIFTSNTYHINSVCAIQRRNFTIDALEKYDQLLESGTNPPTMIVKASIKALFNELRGNIKATDPERFEKIEVLLDSKGLEKYKEAYYLIDDWLIEKKVTLFVRTKTYDRTDIEEESIAFGL